MIPILREARPSVLDAILVAAVALAFSGLGCSRALPTAGRSVPLRIELAVPARPSVPGTGAQSVAGWTELDSIRVSAYDIGTDLLRAVVTFKPTVGVPAQGAVLVLPYAPSYRITAEGLGRQTYISPQGIPDSSLAGLQYYGEQVVRLTPEGATASIDFRDIVPYPGFTGYVAAGWRIAWAPIPGAVSYLVTVTGGEVFGSTDTSFIVPPTIDLARVSARLPRGVQSAFSVGVPSPGY